MLLDVILLFLALVMCLIGLIGAIVPGIPGPPISFVGIVLLVLCPGLDPSFPIATYVIVSLFIAAAVTLLDFVAPVWLTKRSGGSKSGVRGATIGMIAGFVASCFGFFIGILLGPFLGAYIGEVNAGTPRDKALRIACFSFLSFLLTTGLKMVYSFAVLAIVLYEGFALLFS